MKTVNSQCKTGFILGLLSFFLNFTLIIPLLALIFGIIGLAKFNPENHKHQWMGWTAAILGFIHILSGLYNLGVFK